MKIDKDDVESMALLQKLNLEQKKEICVQYVRMALKDKIKMTYTVECSGSLFAKDEDQINLKIRIWCDAQTFKRFPREKVLAALPGLKRTDLKRNEMERDPISSIGSGSFSCPMMAVFSGIPLEYIQEQLERIEEKRNTICTII